MTLRIRLGPLVSFEVEGENCRELADALDDFNRLNRTVDAMCSDLAVRVYPNPPAGQTQSGPTGEGQEEAT
jgi:hypothetical protein